MCFDAVMETGIVDPPLTAVQVPVPAMGAAAARMLIDVIENSAVPTARMRLPEALVLGRSTAAPVLLLATGAIAVPPASTRRTKESLCSVLSVPKAIRPRN